MALHTMNVSLVNAVRTVLTRLNKTIINIFLKIIFHFFFLTFALVAPRLLFITIIYFLVLITVLFFNHKIGWTKAMVYFLCRRAVSVSLFSLSQSFLGVEKDDKYH